MSNVKGQALPDSGLPDFTDELSRFAAGQAHARLTAIAARAAAPLRVAVRGRRGVGRGTVARALAASALSVAAPEADGDVDVVVYVTAEVFKPEDADAIGAASRPVVAVLNKADLVGPLSGRARDGDGPITAARSRCDTLAELFGAPVEPMIGLLAVAALDGLTEKSWAALSMLAAHPGALLCLDGSFAGYLAADNPLPYDARLHLLETLDLFGIALGIAAVCRGGTAAQVRALLRRVSCLDSVLGAVTAAGAARRYQRVLDAVAELEALAVGSVPGQRIWDFLSRDATVLARMAAAVEFERSTPGPARELHRASGADIARGSLRMSSQTCGLTLRPAKEAR